MKKAKFESLGDIVQGGGLGVSLRASTVMAVNLDVQCRDIRPISSGNILPDLGVDTTANILTNICLSYDAGYDVFMTLAYSGVVTGLGLPTTESVIKSIQDNVFRFDNLNPAVDNTNADNHVIVFNSEEIEKQFGGFYNKSKVQLWSESTMWFTDNDSINTVLKGYAESLNIKVNPIYNCFNKEMRIELDKQIREEAVILMQQRPY